MKLFTEYMAWVMRSLETLWPKLPKYPRGDRRARTTFTSKLACQENQSKARINNSSHSSRPLTRDTVTTMTTESDLRSLLEKLSSLPATSPQTSALLSKAKLALLHLKCLLPTPTTSPSLLALARQTLEAGALISIRLQDPDAFTRYYQQLQPFYELPPSSYPPTLSKHGQRSKVTGLYLLLLLTKGDYAGFHTLLEGLEVEAQGKGLEEDVFLQYPVKLEQWLMEGAYDRVWGATKREEVPSEEFGVFSEVSLDRLFSFFALLHLSASLEIHYNSS